ncbi:MAG: Nif3-like dinuclear metal center hexameric protein [Treponema sp.]
MTLTELDRWFRSFLALEVFSTQDPSQNGIQVQNTSPATKPITKVAVAVDACAETIKQAAVLHADLLFVHHGLFWKHNPLVTGSHYQRLAMLFRHDMALYACHIPLDAHNSVGNNYGLASLIGLQQLEPFGMWKGMTIGVKGIFPQALPLDMLTERLFPHGGKPLAVLPFGTGKIKTAAIISGGGGHELLQAIESGVDAYITGEIGHEEYHTARECGIHVIAGGHYYTETIGVLLIAEKITKELGIETVFIDVPTGL